MPPRPVSPTPDAARRARPDEAMPLGRVLARAFRDDPVQRWLYPSDAEWARGSHRMFREIVRIWSAIGEVWTRDDHAGAAVWVPPGPPKPPWLANARFSAVALYALRGRAQLAGRGFAAMERRHPKEPHWYLMVLGAEPERQRSGVGSGLLRPLLERCDRDGTLAWLESSKRTNIPFYQRHGFDLVDEVPLPEGPSVWLMQRVPRR